MMKQLKKKKKKHKNKRSAGATSGSANTTDANEPYVLAVTACPTGIAHTYMARDALKTSR